MLAKAGIGDAATRQTPSIASSGEQDSGAAPAWRHLPFYEASLIRDANDFASSPAVFRTTNNVSKVISCRDVPNFCRSHLLSIGQQSSTSNSRSKPASCALVAQKDGKVIVCETDHYEALGLWSAYRSAEGLSGRLSHISCSNDSVYLVTVGEDYDARFPVLRIWDLRKTATTTNSAPGPQLLAEAKIQNGSKPHPVACIAHTPSLTFIAAGLGDGTVLLLRNVREVLDQSHRRSNAAGSTDGAPLGTLPKFKVVQQNANRSAQPQEGEPVTCLGFREEPKNTSATAPPSHAAESTPRNRQRKRINDVHFDEATALSNGAPQAVDGGGAVHLFIVNLSKISLYVVLGKNAGAAATPLDDVGCSMECADVIALAPQKRVNGHSNLPGKAVIARDEAIYVVGSDGREMSLAYEGRKAAIRLNETQLIMISPPAPATAASNSATIRHRVNERDRGGGNDRRQGSGSGPDELSKITVFDLDSKVVAHSSTFNGGIRDAWIGADGELYVLTDEGILTRLDEKTLRQKLDILFRKSLYLLAISVAKSHTARYHARGSAESTTTSDALLGDIYRKYGDFLYDKGDFEGAVSQYVKTIGVTQPSYVIRKFLDAQRIVNLTTYLQELHNRGYANADHTTLLLNCFAKLKDVASLDKFIKRPVERSAKEDSASHQGDELDDDDLRREELPFDLNTAIRVCRQGGYFQHAAYLAQRYAQHDEYVRIQIEDVEEYNAALQYIRSLPLNDAERNLSRYGRKLLAHDARGTTDLMIEICSGVFEPRPIAVGSGIDASKVDSRTGYLSYLNVGGKFSSKQDAPTPSSEPQPDLHVDSMGKTPPPSAQIFFAHFLDERQEFVRFLETVALARFDQAIVVDGRDDQPEGPLPDIEDLSDADDDYEETSDPVQEQRIIWNTMLELYLTLGRKDTGDAKASNGQAKYEMRAISLLRQFRSLPYDIGQALIICTEAHFVKGIVFLYERMGMYEEILRLLMDLTEEDANRNAERRSKIVAALDRYGPQQPELYPIVLSYLVADKARLNDNEKDVEHILKYVFDEALMSPLEVVQLLSKKGVANIGMLREHLIRTLEAQQRDIDTNAGLTKAYRTETQAKQADLDALQDVTQPRVFQQTKCSVCSGTLDLPSVHFMCRHSFHARCLGAEENECPVCAQSHGVVLEIRRNNAQFAQRHDMFIEEVAEAEETAGGGGGFDVIAGMFSKGLFSAATLSEAQKP